VSAPAARDPVRGAAPKPPPPPLPLRLGRLVHLVRRVAVLPIVAYRRWISPWTPPTCRFRPTCSAYVEEAILSHGLVKGSLLGAWRILRCHPFSRGGAEPVPPHGRWRARP
jgi:hypothetical protein